MGARLLITCLLLFFITALFAKAVTGSRKENLDIIFSKEEVKPFFNGGNVALAQYVNENVNTNAENEGEEGMIRFIVSAKGNIYDVKIISGNITFERSLKKALLKSSGMWTAGLQNNSPVNSYCTLKVTFENNTIAILEE